MRVSFPKLNVNGYPRGGRPKGSKDKNPQVRPQTKDLHRRVKFDNQWQDKWFVQIYRLACDGLEDYAIRQALGMTKERFDYYVQTKPALQEALTLARSQDTGKHGDYVYNRLPPEVMKVWKRLQQMKKTTTGKERVQKYIGALGKITKQQIFIHACIQYDFNLSLAAEEVNLSYNTIQQWVKSDQDFAKLLDEIHWHRGNVVESALMSLVKDGNVPATIYADKKYSGYKEKTSLDVTMGGKVTHEHVLTLNDLELPVETQAIVLDAIKRWKSELALENKMLDEHTGIIKPGSTVSINGKPAKVVQEVKGG